MSNSSIPVGDRSFETLVAERQQLEQAAEKIRCRLQEISSRLEDQVNELNHVAPSQTSLPSTETIEQRIDTA